MDSVAQECQVTLFQGSLEIIWLTDEKRKTFALFLVEAVKALRD